MHAAFMQPMGYGLSKHESSRRGRSTILGVFRQRERFSQVSLANRLSAAGLFYAPPFTFTTTASMSHIPHPDPRGIYLISPSGAVADPSTIEVACQRLGELGFATAVDPAALLVHERFAGTDEQRLEGIQRALKQEHPVVMATRGGYGLSRLLGAIDWQAVADSGKTFIGHSDFTVFNLALLARTGATSLSGPSAVFDFGGKKVDDLTADLMAETLRGELEVLSFESPGSDPVDARGILWGGNLAMVASLVGTPYMPQV